MATNCSQLKLKMTCYDCIHCGACSDAGDSGFSCLKEDVSKCKHFRNKADYAEVVRCKDCKFSVMGKDWINRTVYKCNKHDIRGLSADDFCSYGDRSDT